MGYQKSVQSFTGLAWPGNRLPSCWLSACQHSLWVLVSWVPHFSFYPLALHSVFPPVLSSRSSFSSCYLHFFFLPNTCEYCHSSHLSMSLTFILYFLPRTVCPSAIFPSPYLLLFVPDCSLLKPRGPHLFAFTRSSLPAVPAWSICQEMLRASGRSPRITQSKPGMLESSHSYFPFHLVGRVFQC